MSSLNSSLNVIFSLQVFNARKTGDKIFLEEDKLTTKQKLIISKN